MKFAPPVLFGTLVIALAAAAFALASSSDPPKLKPFTTPTANAVGSASVSTPTSIRGAINVTTAVPGPLDLSVGTPLPTATLTEIPALPPPTPPEISSAAYQQGIILRRDGDYAHAVESFRAALGEKPDPSSAREIQFRLGESAWLGGDFGTAISAFDTLLAQDSSDSLAARAHYFLADILTQRKSYSQAIEHLRAYRTYTRTLMGEIDAQTGDLFLEVGNAPEAIAQYDAAVKDSTLTAGQRVDFLQRIAGVQSTLGHPGLAAARLSEAYSLAPDDKIRAEVEYRWGLALDEASQGADAVSHWQQALSAYPATAGAYESLVELLNRQVPVDDYQRGLTDYFSNSYGPAILAFNRYISANPKGRAPALYYSALAYMENGQTALAVKSFDALLKDFPGDSRAPAALYNKARAYDRSGDWNSAVAAYVQFADHYPADSLADDALWQAGRSLDAAGRSGEARAQYERLAAKYPSSPQAPTALFTVGFDYFLSQDYANAQSSWMTLAKLFPNAVDASRALFWLGKLSSTQGDAGSAQRYFEQAAATPRTYYSWRALDKLAPSEYAPSYDVAVYGMVSQPTDRVNFEQWLARWNGGRAVSSELGATVLNDFHFRRGWELAQLDRAAEARLEFQKVNTNFKSDARTLYALTEYYRENNYFDLSIQAAAQIQALSGAGSDQELPHYLRALIYPTYYSDLIVPYAQRNGVDPALLFALVRQESGYNPLSNSGAGATGLTQVMPQTGSGIARELGLGGYQQADLFKPYVSIRFGGYFLGQMIRYFDGNIFYGLSGYNGGPGNAKKWVRPDTDVGIEAIDLAESSLYVRTVYSQYNQYIEIYRGK